MLAPVLLAALASFALGAIWYGPLFGRYWMGLMGFTSESMKAMPLTPARAMTIGAVAQVIFAAALFRLVELTGVVGLSATLSVGLWIWIGFYATATIGVYLWEGKPLRLALFNMAYQLASVLAAAAIIGAWR
jgi:hypothetical protein